MHVTATKRHDKVPVYFYLIVFIPEMQNASHRRQSTRTCLPMPSPYYLAGDLLNHLITYTCQASVLAAQISKDATPVITGKTLVHFPFRLCYLHT
jgi:hypothetical protein